MLELKSNRLAFHFPEVHPCARLEVIFHRTLRVPDDGRTYPLPPSLGAFPVVHVDDFEKKVPKKWLEHGGVMLPMWQSEAMWLQFSASPVPGHGHVWPFAIKVSTGKRSAVTGKPWSKVLREGDYLIVPEQKWLDGYVVEDGAIRQFVAAPLGMGATAEEQITGKAEFGGLQIEAYPMSRAEYERRWPPIPQRHVRRRSVLRGFGTDHWNGTLGMQDIGECLEEKTTCGLTPNGPSEVDVGEPISCSANAVYTVGDNSRGIVTQDCSFQPISETARPDMGLAPGGRMAQQVFSDIYGIDAWEKSQHDRCFVHLSNSIAWRAITGKDAPTIPLSAADYSRHGMPWYEHYKDAPTVKVSSKLSNLKSAVQIGQEKGIPVVLENESAQPKAVVHIGEVRDGEWG